jgi:hypothetical protein
MHELPTQTCVFPPKNYFTPLETMKASFLTSVIIAMFAFVQAIPMPEPQLPAISGTVDSDLGSVSTDPSPSAAGGAGLSRREDPPIPAAPAGKLFIGR